jgi:hypothetical protein
MSYQIYLEYDSYKQAFGDSIACLARAGEAIDRLTAWDLENLVHALYGKWPHNLNVEIMRKGVKRATQTRFYKQIYKTEVPEKVLKEDQKAADMLLLSDMAYQKPQPKTNEIEKPKVQKPKIDKPKVEKPPKPPKNEFSGKVAGMTLEEVIAWAQELGVPNENIEKHKAKPLGLAKMNISNMIRARLK